MDYETAYAEFLERHLKSRQGEARRRLAEGHGHAEQCFLQQVWWPAFRQFDQLIPEYEVHDFRDGTRFLDFAYIRDHVRLAIEIDGYGPHLQKISRTQFSDQWMRQNHLILDGWKVLRFSYDDVKDRPRRCEQLLHQFMGRWFGSQSERVKFSAEEKEILRFTLRNNRSVRPREVCMLLYVEQQKARRLLHGLLDKKALIPAGKSKERIYRYKLSSNFTADMID